MEAAMRKLCIFVVVAFFVFSIGALLAQNAASNSCSNPGEVKSMVNPVKPTAESLAQGKKYYGYDCAMCHGATGNGKGEVDTGDKLPDFTNADSMKVMSDGPDLLLAKDRQRAHASRACPHQRKRAL